MTDENKPLTLNNPFMHVYISCDHEFYKVQKVCTNVTSANDYCMANEGVGVIATDDSGLIYIAEIKGRKA